MPPSLPRRAFLGIRLPPGDGAFDAGGAHVGGVAPGGMAEAADLATGDIVLRVGDYAAASLEALLDAARRIGSADEVTLAIDRAGERLEKRVRVRHWPSEVVDGSEVAYGAVEACGAVLRTIETRPLGDRPTPVPAIMVLQGIGLDTIDFGAAPRAPLAQLVHGWAREGIATLRVDKRGVGDSEGAPAEAADFETELAGWRAGLALLASRPWVDPERIVLFGHSVGGMAAPLLARSGGARAVVVYGTSALPWLDCLFESAHRQLRLRGVEPSEIERRLSLGEHLRGRSRPFHLQLDRARIADAWAAVAGPVLVAYGQHDWVVSDGEGRHIVQLVCRHRPSGARFVEVPGLDHWLTRHESVADSLRAPAAGADDSALLGESVRFVRALG